MNAPTPQTAAPQATPQQAVTPQTGRPPVLGPNQRKRLIALITAGCSRRAAARTVGCATGTITQTAARDRQFADELAHAESNLEVRLLKAVCSAAENDRYWRAAGWLLERKYPVDYTLRPPGTYTAEQVNTCVSAILESLREELSPEQRNRAIQKLDSMLLAMAE